jgi:hypothetical protein
MESRVSWQTKAIFVEIHTQQPDYAEEPGKEGYEVEH